MLKILLSMSILMSFMLSCGSAEAHQSFLPENDLWKQDNLFYFSGVNQTDFTQVANKIYSIYKPIVARLGGNLVMKLDYANPTVNAYADRDDGNWNISFFGGLARRPEMTPGGFALVICHELAHHIGGHPFYPGEWAADEGQSDTMAAQVCLKKYFAGIKENVKVLSTYAVSKCKSSYKGQELRECYHRMASAKSCADVLGALGGRKPRFDTPDQSVVWQTAHEHPGAQCRLDQYVAATLCKTPWNDGIIPSARDHLLYNCQGDTDGRRRCWYAP